MNNISFRLVLPVLFFLLAVSGTQAASRLDISHEPAAFTAPVSLNITELSFLSNIPWQQVAITPAYDYSFATTGFYDPSWPLSIRIYYGDSNKNHKQIYVQDSLSGVWRPLATADHPADKYVSATTDSVQGRLIVLADPELMSVGKASWYKFRNGLFAASPDYAKGSVLRVYNLDNGKSVDITVNDYGPDRSLFPDRVIDLDYVAFQKIASAGAGVIRVKVEPIKVVVSATAQATPQLSDVPNITATSAVVILESTGETIWSKDAERVAPLASLTKLVAAQVFLDTKPDLSKVVDYKYQDEKYNYAYVKPWESARLAVKEGETLTIEDLLYSALVGSANNAMESLVRVSGLGRNEFIAAMNEAVRIWGATSTRFVEPTGLSPQNMSSAFDYAIISKEVLAHPIIKKLSTTLRYSFTTKNTKKKHNLTNTNQLLRSNNYSITGSKTGYLDEAGYCLMTRVATPQGNLISINFGSANKAANFRDNELLIQYGQTVLKNNQSLQ